MIDLTIIIPCYNEAKSIPDLFNQIKLFKTKYKFLIVDNGSSDNTSAVIENLIKPSNVKVKFKKLNTGYGAGIKFGLTFVKSKYVGWMHADLQQDIAVLDNIENDLNNIVKNSNKENFAMKGHRTKRNFFDNFFTISVSIFASLLFLKKFWDVAGQPNIFSRKDTEFIKYAPNDHTFEFYVYFNFILNGGKFYRFNAPFLKRKYGISSWDNGLKSKILHSFTIFKFIIKLRFKFIHYFD